MSFGVDTEKYTRETNSKGAIKSGAADAKSAFGLTGRSLSLRWPDFVVRMTGGQRPIFAMSNATIVYLEGFTSTGPFVQIVFSGEPQGEFKPVGGLSISIFTEDAAKGVIDEWPLSSWGDNLFCYPPKPASTQEKRLGPLSNVDYFSEISLARIEVPATHWNSCDNVKP